MLTNTTQIHSIVIQQYSLYFENDTNVQLIKAKILAYYLYIL